MANLVKRYNKEELNDEKLRSISAEETLNNDLFTGLSVNSDSVAALSQVFAREVASRSLGSIIGPGDYGRLTAMDDRAYTHTSINPQYAVVDRYQQAIDELAARLTTLEVENMRLRNQVYVKVDLGDMESRLNQLESRMHSTILNTVRDNSKESR